MSSETGRKSSRERTQAYRERKRADGYRLVQIWLPDVDSDEFKKRARRAATAIANSPHEPEDQAFVDSVSILNDL